MALHRSEGSLDQLHDVVVSRDTGAVRGAGAAATVFQQGRLQTTASQYLSLASSLIKSDKIRSYCFFVN